MLTEYIFLWNVPSSWVFQIYVFAVKAVETLFESDEELLERVS